MEILDLYPAMIKYNCESLKKKSQTVAVGSDAEAKCSKQQLCL